MMLIRDGLEEKDKNDSRLACQRSVWNTLL